MKFKSIILLEIFTHEDFTNLIVGLDKLYENLPKSTEKPLFDEYSDLEQIKKGLKNPDKSRKYNPLPTLHNYGDSEKTITGISLNLGNNIDSHPTSIT